MTEDDLIIAFENAALPAASFHHADHVRLAYLYLLNYPPLDALLRFSAALKRFAAANGKPGLYHETVTWAFVFLIHERMARAGRRETWEEFSAENQDLMDWKNNVLKKHYCEQTLSSELAKSTFLFPDKIGPDKIGG